MKGGIRIGHFFRRRQRRTSPLERPNDDPDDQTQNNERDLTWTHAQSQSNGQHIANLEPSPDVVGEEDIHQGKKKKKFSNPLYENLLAKGVVGKYVEDVDPDQQNILGLVLMKGCQGFSNGQNLSLTLATFFDFFVLLIILSNCVLLAFRPEEISSYNTIEIGYNVVYTIEMTLKIIARGFIIHRFAYLRDPWNWLDFLVVVLGFVAAIPQLSYIPGIGVVRVFRALRMITVIDGLKTMVNAMLKSLRMLTDVFYLTIFFLCIFGLLGLQMFMGVLSQKCCLPYDYNRSAIDPSYPSTLQSYVLNETLANWLRDGDDYIICGNSSTARSCSKYSPNHVCYEGALPNPNDGYTSFDNFPISLLNSFQLVTMDFWEDPYNKISDAVDIGYALFFVFVIILGSFYLLNLVIAVVSMAYNQEDRLMHDLLLNHSKMMIATKKSSVFPYYSEKAPTLWTLQNPSQSNIEEGTVKKDAISINTTNTENDAIKKNQSLQSSPRRLMKRTSLYEDALLSGIMENKDLLRRRLIEINRECPLDSLPYTKSQSQEASKVSGKQNNHSDMASNSSDGSLDPNHGQSSQASSNSRHDNKNERRGANSISSLTSTELTNASSLSSSTTIKQRESLELQILQKGEHDHSVEEREAAIITENDDTDKNDEDHHRPTQRKAAKDNDSLDELINESTQLALRNITKSSTTSSNRGKNLSAKASNGKRKESESLETSSISQAGFSLKSRENSLISLNAKAPNKARESIGGFAEPAIAEAKELVSIESENGDPAMSDSVTDPSIPRVGKGPCWQTFRSPINKIVTDPLFDLIITFCIALNTLFMALYQPNPRNDPGKASLNNVIQIANYVFTGIFTLEMVLKLIAFTPSGYISSKWNVFDGLVVIVSYLDFILSTILQQNRGLAVLRTFRLLRVFKLAQSWTAMRTLVRAIVRSLSAIFYVTLILFLVLYVFAVLGMKIFRQPYLNYYSTVNFPRWNFNTFFDSFMLIFRVLCGEWVEPLYEAMRATNPASIIFFISAYVIGNLLVLNLFLALLLSSFENVSFTETYDQDTIINNRRASPMISIALRLAQILRADKLYFYMRAHFGCCKRAEVAEINPPNKEDESSVISQSIVMDPIDLGYPGSSLPIQQGKVFKLEPIPGRKTSDAPSRSITDLRGFIIPSAQDLQRSRKSVPNISLQGHDLRGMTQDLRNTTRSKNSVQTIPIESKIEFMAVNASNRSSNNESDYPVDLHNKVYATSSKKNNGLLSTNSNGKALSASCNHLPVGTRHHSGSGLTLCHVGTGMASSENLDNGISNPKTSLMSKSVTQLESKNETRLIIDRRRSTRSVNRNHSHLSEDDDDYYYPEQDSDESDDEVIISSDDKPSRVATPPLRRGQVSRSSFVRLGSDGDIDANEDEDWSASRCESTVGDAEEAATTTNLPAPCFPRFVSKCFPACRSDEWAITNYWVTMRIYVKRLVEHRVFEGIILLLIFASSVILALEDAYILQRQDLARAIEALNVFFAIAFTVEMVLKWIGLGFVAYFTNPWNLLDASIVAISLVTIILRNLAAFRSLRTLRALRPLRAVSHWEGMKVVVNALFGSIPSIANVILVGAILWLIFGISGMYIFGGLFYKCEDAAGNRMNASIIPNRTVCLDNGLTWQNSLINFDSVPAAFLALFQVATFEGWMEIMRDATDAKGIDLQPVRLYNKGAYVYFVIFIFFGTFFTLNLIVSVIIDNFYKLKRTYERNAAGIPTDILLTESQKKWYKTMQKLSKKKPTKQIPPSRYKWQNHLLGYVQTQRFDLFIMTIIFANTITMMVNHYQEAKEVSDALHILFY
ncbi:uncharacterized protein TRIADDRAFT_54699 [Trichoplax adhaerens]|uniref:Ion transport domain-containing protein n=1 Tax=Trichoplax adhaerens TaxID=10228 RepID=B3RSR3_TRIAD|nr:hypothetical protein TRIADDRAFT_54699 [Trichoplax adhaerens]EDV26563.1 hypothetical protein TRIADDRAFT_54699 [Trichoplax adhaerens]|eukprot:XP_002110559.1 hypothetical protein TRIADDRAFT_54699 [Trichoplax adhaerens]